MGKITSLGIAVLLLFATGARAEQQLCFDEAGAMYGINPLILRAIAKVESNFNPRAINWNTNGTYDFGVMQINTIWAPVLGTERWNTLGDPCTNIKTGAMILADCMKKYGYTWEAIGCYNSRTPDKRDKYARKVFTQLKRIEREEKQLKNNLEAAVRDRIEDLVKASQNGQGSEQVIKIQAEALIPSEVPRDLPVPPAGQPPVPDGRVELSASSQFEGSSQSTIR